MASYNKLLYFLLCFMLLWLVACDDTTQRQTTGGEGDLLESEDLQEMERDTSEDVATPDLPSTQEGSCDGYNPPFAPQGALSCPGEEVQIPGLPAETVFCAPQAPRAATIEQCPHQQYDAYGVCAPQPPSFSVVQCPEGWLPLSFTADGEDYTPGCQPIMPEDPCPPGFTIRLGETACVPLGVACPTDGERWASEDELRLRAPGFVGRVVYVHPTSPEEEALGTRQQPFSSLEQAFAQVQAGDILALSSGAYTGSYVIDESLAILGACQETLWVNEGDEPALTVRERALVRDVNIQTSSPGLMVMGPSAELRLDFTSVEAAGFGLEVSGQAQAELHDVVVHDMQPWSQPNSSPVIGVKVREGGQLVGDGLVFERNQGVGLDVEGAQSHVRAQDILSLRSVGISSIGVWIAEEASAELERVVLSDHGLVGLSVSFGAEAHVSYGYLERNNITINVSHEALLHMDHMVARDSQEIFVRDQAHLIADYLTLENMNSSTGSTFVLRTGGHAEVHHFMTVDTLRPVNMLEGTSFLLEDAVFIRAKEAQIFTNEDTSLEVRRMLAIESGCEGLFIGVDPLLEDLLLAYAYLEDIDIRGTGCPSGRFRPMVTVAGGAEVDIKRLWGTRWQGPGIVALGVTAQARIEDFHYAQAPMSDGALEVLGGARVEAQRLSMENNRGYALQGLLPGAVLRAEDVTIIGSSDVESYGVAVSDGGDVSLQRVLINGARHIAMAVYGSTSNMSVQDLVIRQTTVDPRIESSPGMGILVLQGANVSVTRGLVEDNEALGVGVTTQSALELVDVQLLRTQPWSTFDLYGRGLEVSDGAFLDAQRLWVDSSHEQGVIMNGTETTAQLRDVVLTNTQGQRADMEWGRGLAVQSGAHVDVERIHVEGNLQFGISVSGEGSFLRGEDVLTASTKPSLCGDRCDAWNAAGIGLMMWDGGEADLTRLQSRDNREHAGLFIRSNAKLTVREGLVEGNRFGLHLSEGGQLDFERLCLSQNNDVRYSGPEYGDPLSAEGLAADLAPQP